MSILKKVVFVICFCNSVLYVAAQEDSAFQQKAKSKPLFKFGLSTQSSYSSFGGGASAFGNYLIPTFSYNDGSKWKFEGTVALGTTKFNGFNTSAVNGMNSILGNSATDISFYTKGSYQLTSKLTVNSVVYRNSGTNVYYGNVNPKAFDLSSTGAMLGFSYKFSDRFQFDAGISINKGYSPWQNTYGYSPFYNRLIPFGW
jgi:hypothetical protein